MGQLPQVFRYEHQPIRMVMVEHEPWWVLKDVCDVLGLSNARMIADRLDEDDVSQAYVTDSLGRDQQTNIVNESGLYDVILRSDKPEARRFKHWVTHDVIPQIRRTGVYDARVPRTLSEALRLAADQAEQIEEQQRQIALLKPAAEFGETVGSSKGAILIRDFVKLLVNDGIQIGQNEFFTWLHDKGYIYRHNDQWKPNRRYVDMGLFKLVERPISTAEHGDIIKLTIRITGKGQQYFYDKLRSSEQTA